jgi:hypothetical protein
VQAAAQNSSLLHIKHLAKRRILMSPPVIHQPQAGKPPNTVEAADQFPNSVPDSELTGSQPKNESDPTEIKVLQSQGEFLMARLQDLEFLMAELQAQCARVQAGDSREQGPDAQEQAGDAQMATMENLLATSMGQRQMSEAPGASTLVQPDTNQSPIPQSPIADSRPDERND